MGILEQELREFRPIVTSTPSPSSRTSAGEIKHLDDFVSEFLRFARPPTLNVERLAVRPLITDLVAFIAPECSKKGGGSQADLRGPDSAMVDGFQLKQAVLNLVLNALQATPKGGLIVVRTAGDKKRFLIAVADDGEGMSPEDQERAFTPFFKPRARTEPAWACPWSAASSSSTAAPSRSRESLRSIP